MTGLVAPAKGRITQGFDGDYPAEPAGWLEDRDDKPWRGKRTVLPFGAKLAHVHLALDIANEAGTAIVAPQAGRIVAHTHNPIGGYGVKLLTAHGVVHYLCHVRSTGRLPVGAWATQGQRIALMGATGAATGPHVHWEVQYRDDGTVATSYSWPKFNGQRLIRGHDMAGSPLAT